MQNKAAISAVNMDKLVGNTQDFAESGYDKNSAVHDGTF
jgi:hypothetical protein